MELEFVILDFIQKNIKNPFLDKIMPVVSMLGALGIIWIVFTIIALITKKYRRLGTKLSFTMILSLIVCNCILKPVVSRIRPYDLNSTIQLMVAPEIDTSFPSGHTFFAFSTATVCFMYNKRLGVIMYLFAVLMAFSRLYLYVHFPTDVLFGAIFGIITGIIAGKLENYVFGKELILDNKAY